MKEAHVVINVEDGKVYERCSTAEKAMAARDIRNFKRKKAGLAPVYEYKLTTPDGKSCWGCSRATILVLGNGEFKKSCPVNGHVLLPASEEMLKKQHYGCMAMTCWEPKVEGKYDDL